MKTFKFFAFALPLPSAGYRGMGNGSVSPPRERRRPGCLRGYRRRSPGCDWQFLSVRERVRRWSHVRPYTDQFGQGRGAFTRHRLRSVVVQRRMGEWCDYPWELKWKGLVRSPRRHKGSG